MNKQRKIFSKFVQVFKSFLEMRHISENVIQKFFYRLFQNSKFFEKIFINLKSKVKIIFLIFSSKFSSIIAIIDDGDDHFLIKSLNFF